ncbi:hypothetical protein Tco_1315820 [Tanacetum coccineum]
MDDPNITIEEYIRLEEEKDRKRGRVFNWKTTKYGRIWNDEDIHDLKSVEIEFPAIAFNDEVSSKTLSYEPTGPWFIDADIVILRERLERIYSREIHKVQVVDFQGMPELMRDGLFARMVMEHRDDAGVVIFTSQAWGRLFDTRGPLVEPGDVCSGGGLFWPWDYIPGKRWSPSVLLDFLGPPPSYTLIRDSMLRLFHRMMAHSIAGRSQAPEKEVCCWEEERGLTLISPELPIIDMAELVRLQIYEQLDDAWVWVAGPERKPNATGPPGVAQDAPIVNKGGQADPAPTHAPPPPPATARTMPQRMARLEEDVHEIHGTLAEQHEVASDDLRDALSVIFGLSELKGKLSLRVENETVTFNIRKSMEFKYSHDDYLYCADHTVKLIREQWVDTIDYDRECIEADEGRFRRGDCQGVFGCLCGGLGWDSEGFGVLLQVVKVWEVDMNGPPL